MNTRILPNTEWHVYPDKVPTAACSCTSRASFYEFTTALCSNVLRNRFLRCALLASSSRRHWPSICLRKLCFSIGDFFRHPPPLSGRYNFDGRFLVVFPTDSLPSSSLYMSPQLNIHTTVEYSHYWVFVRIPNTKYHFFMYSQVFASLKRHFFGLLGSLGWAWIHSWTSKSSIISEVSQINCICWFLHAKAMQIYLKNNKICV